MKKASILILYLLILSLVPMFLGAYENDVVNQSVLPTVKSGLRENFWDFETGWQGWTHTNGQPFPCGWDVERAMLHSNANSPEPGDSSMWVDSYACGSGYTIWDTCYSPVVVPPVNMAWLKWGCGYQNFGGTDWFTVGVQTFSGGAWNPPVELKLYNSDIGPDIWDSVDVTAYQGDDSIRVFFSYNDANWAWFASFDNVELAVPLDHDVGCDCVISPPGGFVPPVDYDIIGQIHNFGSNAETFDVKAGVWDITGGSWVQIFDQTVTLTDFPSGADSFVNFGSLWFGYDKVFYTEIYTELVGDEDPSNDTSFVFTMTEPDYIIFELDVQTPTGDSTCLGVEFDGTYFYVTGGNNGSDPNKVYVLDTLGTLIWTLDQPAHSTGWGWRDLAWDNAYSGPDKIDTLWASVDPNVDGFSIDLTAGTLAHHVSYAGQQSPNRALAWMPDGGWFWTANWSYPVYWFDKVGNSGSAYNFWSMYGAAYDPGVGGFEGPWIWWHSQDDAGFGWPGQIEQFDPQTMTFTGVTFGYMPTITVPGYAGGLCFYESFRGGMDVLFALVQGTPDAIIGLFVRYLDVAEKVEEKIPIIFGLSNIAPNPVRDGTIVSYITTRKGPVTLKVYDSTGRLVKTVIDRKIMSAGHKTVYWDGRDNNHRSVAAGVYFLRLQVENRTATKKIVVVR